MVTELTGFKYSEILSGKLNTLKQQGNYRYFLPIQKSVKTHPVFKYMDDGVTRTAVNWTSNDYLGMSVDPDVIAEFIEVAQNLGIGSGGTRNISGTSQYHIELEKTLSELHSKPSALVFSSAYLANCGAISVLARAFPDTLIFSDEENHASMIEGFKLSRCEKLIFKHNDLEHLEILLKSVDFDRPKIIAFESVYSMSGTIAPINEICELAKKYNAITYLDEVHAVGMYGSKGEGVAGQLLCSDAVDVINGTLAKSFGCIGGYIVANNVIIDYVRSFGESFIFTSSMPAAICAAAIVSIKKIRNTPALRKLFFENVQTLKQTLLASGIVFEDNRSHIIRIIIGDAKKTKQITNRLLNEFGIYLQPINYPTVPKGKEGLRIVVTAKHSEKQINDLAEALKIVFNNF